MDFLGFLDPYSWSSILITAIAVVIAIIGIIGSLVPGLPGPPIGWCALLVIFFFGGEDFSRGDMPLSVLLIMLVVMIAVTLIDYLLPGKLTKLTGGSKYANYGANTGLVVGIILGFVTMGIGIIGAIIFPFLGAFLFELIFGKKTGEESVRGAAGAFLGLLCGIGLKLIYSCVVLSMVFIY